MAVARLPDPFLRSPLRLASLRNRRRPHRQPRRPQRHRASHDFREAQPFPEAHQRPQRRHHRHQHLDRGTARHRQPLEPVRHRDTPTPPTRPPPVHAVTRRAARGRSRKRTRSRAASKARRAVHSLILEFPWILGSCRKPGERCANVEECPEQPPWPPDGSFCMSGKTSGSIPTTPNGVVTTNDRKFYRVPQHLPVARDPASAGQAPFLHEAPCGRIVTLPPLGMVSGWRCPHPHWEWLWNGDEDVAVPFQMGAVSRCARPMPSHCEMLHDLAFAPSDSARSHRSHDGIGTQTQGFSPFSSGFTPLSKVGTPAASPILRETVGPTGNWTKGKRESGIRVDQGFQGRSGVPERSAGSPVGMGCERLLSGRR